MHQKCIWSSVNVVVIVQEFPIFWTSYDIFRPSKNVYKAAKKGDIFALRQLLQTGKDVNTTHGQWNRSLLAAAARKGRLECMKLLIEKGANVNAVDTKGTCHSILLDWFLIKSHCCWLATYIVTVVWNNYCSWVIIPHVSDVLVVIVLTSSVRICVCVCPSICLTLWAKSMDIQTWILAWR